MPTLDSVIEKTLRWFRAEKTPLPWREDRDPYHVWISEIMLQQTRIETVIPYYRRFLRELPDVAALAACPEEKLLKLWEGLGYYSRARNLKKCAETLVRDHGGAFPRTAEELEKLPGVGAYTAGAIASIAFGEKAPAVDGNVMRVYSRVFEWREDIAKPAVREAIAEKLAARYPSGDEAGELTQGLMEIGERKCLPNGAPLCASCPLADECLARRNGTWDALPVKSPKKARRIEEKTVFLIRRGDRFALEKRPEKGLLAGLFGFPTADGKITKKEAAAALAALGFEVLSLLPCGDAVHVFTHVEWRMTGFLAEVKEEIPGYFWKTKEEIRQSAALPSAFRAFKNAVL